jgi:hypothetical protein
VYWYSVNVKGLLSNSNGLTTGGNRYNFFSIILKTCDQITTAYDNFMFIGDLNYDMLVSDKSSSLQNVCDIFDLTNLVNSPTCYTKNSNPSLNNVILTNMPNN